MSAKGHALPFTVEGFAHPAADGLASGVKDADGMWVAKCHPLNGTADDLKRAETMAHLFAAAPVLLAALEGLLDRAERQAAGMLEEASCEVWYAHRDAARAAIAAARGTR